MICLPENDFDEGDQEVNIVVKPRQLRMINVTRKCGFKFGRLCLVTHRLARHILVAGVTAGLQNGFNEL